VAVTNRSAARHCHDLDLVAGLKQMAAMTIAQIKQSALANGNVKLAPRLPSGPSLYERLGTIHDIESLENIERELREIDETIAGLKKEAEQPGGAGPDHVAAVNHHTPRSPRHQGEVVAASLKKQ
jgi:hypothetical protein